MKLSKKNLTVSKIMDICETHGSLDAYLAYPEDQPLPEGTYAERILIEEGIVSGYEYTEDDLRITNEIIRLGGIMACLKLGLFKNEEQISQALIEYKLDSEKVFTPDEEIISQSGVR